MSAEGPTLATFQPLVGDLFLVAGPGGREAPFELVGATDLSPQMNLPEGYRTPFSLLFRTAEDVDWPQGSYTFTHAALEPLRLFATAVISPEGHGRHAYEVIFS